MIAGSRLLEDSNKQHSLFEYLSTFLTSHTHSSRFSCECVWNGEGEIERKVEVEMEAEEGRKVWVW